MKLRLIHDPFLSGREVVEGGVTRQNFFFDDLGQKRSSRFQKLISLEIKDS
jgi:hypothetical protein